MYRYKTFMSHGWTWAVTPPRWPNAGWWVETVAIAIGTIGLTCLPKPGGVRDYRGLVTHPWTDHCEGSFVFDIENQNVLYQYATELLMNYGPYLASSNATPRTEVPFSGPVRPREDMAEVTLEFLQDLIKEECPDVTITHFEGAPGTKRGDNYTSMVYRITLQGTRAHAEADGSVTSEEPWESSIIYKCLPESIHLRDAFKSDELFCNEVAFYNKIWPSLSNFQKQWDGLKNPFKSIPNCYLAQSDTVVLKDLKRQGFIMPDRRQGLTIEQCYFVLKHLSQFHALCLAMKSHSPEEFYELLNVKDGISEVFFASENEDYYKNYYREAAGNAIAMVEEELQASEDKERYLEKFRKFCSEESFFQTMVELVTPKEPLAVICHGDCWTNNFMFRYVDGDIAEMYIVDFQLVRYASPALDLAFVTYLCLNRQQRDEHLSSLLEYYVDEMHRRLLEMSDDDSIFHTSMTRDVLYEMMQEEFKRCARFGLGIALDMYPIMTCDSKEAPNLYQEKEKETSSHECMKPVWTSNETCRRKMTDLVQELVDNGML